MTPLIGHDSLAAAVLAAAAAVFASAGAARFASDRWLRVAQTLIFFHFVFISIACLALVKALVGNDFHLAYVASYSERALPMFYKFAAFWAGQEGSLLLWAWLLAAVSAVAAWQRRDGRDTARGVEPAVTNLVLAVVCGFFATMLLFAADPFVTLGAAPADGHGLNPLLQAPAMVAHPPVLFLGYAGFVVPFAAMIGALAAGRWNGQWVSANQRWLVFSWLMLSIGILLGAQWAYVELGWGGYWAWDPVENASLLPWLTATALLHSMALQKQRGMMKAWNAWLVTASFFLCIFGTYITRSGVIQSVHAFGESLIGTFFLVFLIVGVAASAAVIVARRRLLRTEQHLEGLLTKEGAFLATNVLLSIITAATLIGTTFPLLSSAFVSEPISVGPAFYNQVVIPMALALLALMATGPLLRYGRSTPSAMLMASRWPALSAVAAIVAAAVMGFWGAWALACAAVAGFAVAAVGVDMAAAVRTRLRHEATFTSAVVHVIDNDHRRYGGQLVHVAMLMVMIGVAGSSLFAVKANLQMTPGQAKTVGGYEFVLSGIDDVRGANFNAVEARLTMRDASGVGAEAGATQMLRPQMRFYDKSEQANSEVALDTSLSRDVYVVLAGWEAGGEVVAIQVMVNPLIAWIWIGGVLMTLGGVFCLAPRLAPRRVGATAGAEVGADAGTDPQPALAGAKA